MIPIRQTDTIESDILLPKDHGGDLAQMLPQGVRCIPVVDEKVLPWFQEKFGSCPQVEAPFVLRKVSERTKTRHKRNAIADYLLSRRAERSTIVLAVGGGVTTDTVGYAAASVKRGLDWITIPTTLLAMVDASVGGKVGINVPLGKNLEGDFHWPRMVLVDTSVSATWTNSHRLEGLAEMYKILRIFDHSAASELAATGDFARWLERSIDLKAQVCNVDPKEHNLRASLNYGHTVGHAIEHITHRRHGLAVVDGIRFENPIAVALGRMSPATCELVDRELDQLGFRLLRRLPTFDRLLPLILQDKKNEGGRVKMSLLGDEELAMEPKPMSTAVDLATLRQVYETHCRQNRIRMD